MGLFGPSKAEQQLQQEVDRLRAMLSPEQNSVMQLQNQLVVLQGQVHQANLALQSKTEQYHELERSITVMTQQVGRLTDEANMMEFGLYKPSYVFANSDLYKNELDRVRQNQKDMIKSDIACICSTAWQVDGNASKGKKMQNDVKKLLLRAFNTECEDIINNVRVSNKLKAEQKIRSVGESISKLGNVMHISISPRYIDLKIHELRLALDYAQVKEDEKERLRELRAQEREEAKAQKEIEEAKKRLEKERQHYRNALAAIMERLALNPNNPDLIVKKAELEANINDADKAIADVDYRQANRRAGYVYVISNIGAFGEDVYKIGMTRRLDPMDRVHELGDASVPFGFDVHALIFTEDAPGLEAALHTAFDSRKVNKVNPRREFFHVTLNEIKQVVRSNFDKTVDWIDTPEANQYRQSIGQMPLQHNRTASPPANSTPVATQPTPQVAPQSAPIPQQAAPRPTYQDLISAVCNTVAQAVPSASCVQEDNPEFVRIHITGADNRKLAIVKIVKSDQTMQAKKLGQDFRTLTSVDELRGLLV